MSILHILQCKTLSGWLYLPTLNSSWHLLRAQSPQTGWLRLFDRNGNVTLTSPLEELVAATSSAPHATELPVHQRLTGDNPNASSSASAPMPSAQLLEQCNCSGSLPEGRWSRLIHYQCACTLPFQLFYFTFEPKVTCNNMDKLALVTLSLKWSIVYFKEKVIRNFFYFSKSVRVIVNPYRI